MSAQMQANDAVTALTTAWRLTSRLANDATVMEEDQNGALDAARRILGQAREVDAAVTLLIGALRDAIRAVSESGEYVDAPGLLRLEIAPQLLPDLRDIL